MAEDHGISTLLDFHQDCLSEKFCGEGIPNWATKTVDGIFGVPMPFAFPFNLGEDGIPTRE
jgi:endoglycosylceramidase